MSRQQHSSDQLFELLKTLYHQVIKSNNQPSEPIPQQKLHPVNPGQGELYPQSEPLQSTIEELEFLYKKYASLFQFVLVGPIPFNREGQIREVNLSGANLIGYDRKQLIGHKMIDFLSEKAQRRFSEHLKHVFEKTGTMIELELRDSSGEYFPIVLESSPIQDDHGNVQLCRSTILDITERKLTEVALKKTLEMLDYRFKKRNRELAKTNVSLQREARRRKIVETELSAEKELLAFTLSSMGDAVITTDEKGDIVLMNEVAVKLTGWNLKQARGKKLSDILNIFDESTGVAVQATPLEDVLKDGKVCELNHTAIKDRRGKEKIIHCSAAPLKDSNEQIIGAVLVIKDITEARRVEEERLRANKLESVGFLAGGIAHDFNNLLTGIVGNITLAKMSTTPDESTKSLLEEAESACTQAKELTNQLLTFSKGGAPVKKITSIKNLIRETVEFIRTGTNVKCNFFVADDLANVEIDENQFKQVINNLTINAIQATPEGGQIDVTCENLDVEDSDGLPVKNGKYVKISICDYGVGIAKKHLDKIFFPYFTTKTKGNQRGRGLGLAVSYSIIKQHGGLITVRSKLRHGSIFQIYLPASNKAIEPEQAPNTGANGGDKHVLVMDDEEIIRGVAVKFLSRLGYHVSTANDGYEALKLYQGAWQRNRPFDAVIMDLTIPGGMGGKEAIEKLRRVNPKVKAIVSSGYSNDPVMAEHRKYGFDAVITKPFNLGDLRAVLNNLLN